ncbi:hypothetical protein WICPIJ_000574 [Wickerhamomyces pijperi]|uniref:Uncharacterized protein n=1 Tax=Wickerhamomyces pijperi TaxID=599730 RepID=A0A9P8QG83_WICPI|nr:hypothetical protein WICPIJ_000574 [Wickerhamomyces pijperi]
MSQIPMYYQQVAHPESTSASKQISLPSMNQSLQQQHQQQHQQQQIAHQPHLHQQHQSAQLHYPAPPQQQMLHPVFGDSGNNNSNITLPSLSHPSSRHGSQTINPNHLPPSALYQPLKPPHQSIPLSNAQGAGAGAPPTSLRRGPWSPEEDRKLLDSINIFGASNWVRISQSLGSRTPKQCRERYHQNLKPSLNRNPITNEEGALIEELVQRYGKRWAEIARHLNGRSDNAIKNWWNGGANRRRRASSQAILEAKSMHPDDLQPLTSSESNNLPAAGTGLHKHTSSIDSNSNSSAHGYNDHIAPHQQQQHQQQPQQGLPSHDQFQRQLSVKRFLEEQHFPQRRHSAQTILSSDSMSPVSSFNFNGGSSRNSLVSLGDYSNSNSRRPSLVFDYANNPNGPFRKNSITSTHSTSSFIQSPVFGGQRNSIAGGIPNITPLSPMVTNSASSQQPTAGSTNAPPQPSFNDNLFKKDFAFNKPTASNQIKLPGPTSIHSNPTFLQPPRVHSGLRENLDSQPPRPLNIIGSSEQQDHGLAAKHELEKENEATLSNPTQESTLAESTGTDSKRESAKEDKQKVMNISNLLG